MELLERESALAALAEVRNAAAAGNGSVVLVTGEPGIGKTALVARFAQDHRESARLLWGNCDDLSIPRPLGPFRDLTDSGPLWDALDQETPAHRLHKVLLEELASPPTPTILVLEDVHWADQATVDAITVIGRRIAGLPAMVVITFRAGELEPEHPLPTALEAIRGSVSLYLQLAPLSRSAVATLAGDDAQRVFGATGGNPFYVTELLAAGNAELPPSVANAVLGRAARLDREARRLVELVSMVPTRASTRVLDLVMPGWAGAAEEPERRQLLSVDPQKVRFRHELARTAIRSSVPAARRRRLHAEILDALLATEADPAEIVHHAEAAGNPDIVAAYALIAARHAAAVESNREAYAHYSRAADFADRLSAHEQAALFEELAITAYTVDRLPDAFAAIEHAIALNKQVGDRMALGRCTRVLSRCHWYAGNNEASIREAHTAITILEPMGESDELARAYSALSQLAMLAAKSEEAVEWGNRAVELAERLGAHAVKAHAMVNIGSVRMQIDPTETGILIEAHRLADEAGDRHEAVRALLNLGYTAFAWVRPETARRYTDDAISYAEEHQVDTLFLYASVMSAWLHLREGNWTEAERIAVGAAATNASVAQLLAKTVLTELAVRRGDPDAVDRLADLAEQAERANELQRIGPVLQLETELALTTGADPPVKRFERAKSMMHTSAGWVGAAVAAWAAVAGVELTYAGEVPEPYRAMLDRDWKRAAGGFGAVGWEYDRALMLSLLDEEPGLTEALTIARRLGARPLEDHVARRLRDSGNTVPPRPRDTTLANPGGLTKRQLEVAALLADGYSNSEIAEQLYISTRTVEHHVEAILIKLNVPGRKQAARRFAELQSVTGGRDLD